jgi:hypothetical protein
MSWNKIFFRFLGLLLLIICLHVVFNIMKGGTQIKPIVTEYQITQAFTMSTLYAVFLFFISRRKKNDA